MEKRILLSFVVLLALTKVASAIVVQGIDMDFVPIGKPGNGTDPVTGNLYGAVAYDYSIGKYEVTNAQWNAFVSAAGAPTGNPSDGYDESAYWTATNVPVNNVSWYEAAQFCNYLTSGDKSLGAYLFSGNNTNPGDFLGIDRNWAVSAYGIAYVIPTGDEWYKAAYYTGSGYSRFANGLDTMVAPGNGWRYGSYPGGSPWVVGSGTMEQNGTFDMMGNVWEWNAGRIYDFSWGIWGGSYYRGRINYYPLPVFGLRSGGWLNQAPYGEYDNVGFRVASVSVYVPEPPEPTAPPIACAGPNSIAYTDINGIATVSLDGTGSYDDDGDELTYLWSWSVDGNDYDANGPAPTIELPVGEHTIELIVNDGIEDSELDEVTIIVIDPLQVRTYYVDDDGPADFDTIQAAVNAAYYGDTVLVADGTYTGDGNRDIEVDGKGITVRSENGPENCIIDCNAMWSEHHRGFTFHNNQDVNSVIEGFTIINGLTWDEGGGAGIICQDSRLTISNCNIRGNTASGRGGYAAGISVIDGIYLINNCTISNNSGEHDGSGGISCENSALTISNSTVTDNFSERRRGGIFCSDDSDVAITNCTISGNSGYWEGGGIECYQSCMIISDCNISGNRAEESWWYSQGGGIKCYDSSSTIINCIISGNTDGGIYCKDSTSTISNCKISGNITCKDTTVGQCGGYGGGIYCEGTSSTIKNCIISGNTSGDEGGGICFKNSSSIISNCTFAGNSSYNGNSLACISPWQAQYPSSVEVGNCILWNGGDEIFNNDGSTITVSYSNIQAGWPGEGNIDADPCFTDPGLWDANGTPDIWYDDFWVEGDYHLPLGSPCINAGDPCYVPEPNETDLDGYPRIINGRIDMGAYEADYIEVEMKFVPQALNLSSGGKLVKAHFVLPEGFSVEDVDANTPAVIEPYGVESYKIKVLLDDEGLVRVEATFRRSDLCSSITSYDQNIELMVTGRLTTGQQFYGSGLLTILGRQQPRQWRRPR
ncbi:MAG: right-handed parallel beta-helix repeat-containing protein [Planctomycetota bacterium]|jgi:parallel beta-helix repeat protein